MADPSAGGLPRATILLVDNESDLRYVTRLLLEHAGHRVVEASNGQDAFEQVISARPDLVLTGVDMPGMDGLELFDRLAIDFRTCDVPVLVWSERPQPGLPRDRVHAKGMGISRLIEHIAQLLGDPT